jgi:ubiquinone/menaquinone biosynthesis C-methylase UbiE
MHVQADRPLDEHVAAFDAGASHKLALLLGCIAPRARGPVLDVGCGPGGVTHGLARAFPEQEVIGIDCDARMTAIAARRYRAENLQFVTADARDGLPEGNAVVTMSGVLHEVYSTSEHAVGALRHVLVRAWRALFPGGVLVIRDFVRPRDPDCRVILEHRASDASDGRRFSDFHAGFAWRTRLARERSRGATARYWTDRASAYEFCFRKDHAASFEFELYERYAFWSETEALELVREAGFRRIRFERVNNDWVTLHRIDRKLMLRSESDGQRIAPCVEQLLLVAER